MPCPNGAYTLRANYSTSGNTHHLAMVGSVRYKNSRALTGACSGFTTGARACPALPASALGAEQACRWCWVLGLPTARGSRG